MRYQTKNSARAELAAKRASLTKVIGEAAFTETQAADNKERLQTQLKKTDEQWKTIYQEDLQGMKLELSAIEVSPWENFCELHPTFKESGAVGHLVHPSGYIGSSTYAVNNEEEGSESERDGYAYKPPAPTKKQYSKYGILHSHGSIEEAIKAANPGDRIYLAPGVHQDDEVYRPNSTLYINHSHEFIGMGKPEDVVVKVSYKGNEPFMFVGAGSVGFFNITFRVNAYEEKDTYHVSHPGIACAGGSAHDAIIEFEQHVDPEKFVESTKDGLFVKNCVFHLGVDCKTAYSTRISGLFLKKGKSATIEGCRFYGGAGNAIAVLSNPHLYIEQVQILRNTFIQNGQPTFNEKYVTSSYASKSDTYKYEPIPDHEIPPGPASVELMNFGEQRPRVRGQCEYEEIKIVSVTLDGNTFSSNLRAPLVNRIIIPCQDDHTYSVFNKKYSDFNKKSTCILRHDIADGNAIGELKGFDLKMTANIMKDNGIQFDQKSIIRMLSPPTKEAAEPKEPPTKEARVSFPDGNTLLVIYHSLSNLNQGFPYNWEYSRPDADLLQEYLSYVS